MKKSIYFLISSLILLLFSCEKSESSKTELTGTWIEVNDKTDTIEFNCWGSDENLIFRRGYDLVNGFRLPKYGSGIYALKLKTDSIAINNLYSNCFCYPTYYFKFNASRDTFQIGNFYDTTKAANYRFSFYRIK